MDRRNFLRGALRGITSIGVIGVLTQLPRERNTGEIEIQEADELVVSGYIKTSALWKESVSGSWVYSTYKEADSGNTTVG